MSSVIEIRRVRPSDAAAITAIYNPFITDTTVSFETEPLTTAQMLQRIEQISAHYPYYVCEIGGQVCGYCYLHPWKERVAYSHTLEVTIYLVPSAQSQGVGRQMLQRLINDGRNMGAKALIACITEENEHSMHFHRSMGFEQVSHFKNVGYKFGRMLDVADFELLL